MTRKTLKKILITFSILIISLNFGSSLSKPKKSEETKNSSEKKKFTFTDAMKFKNVRRSLISENGQWLVYTVSPDRGDGYLVIKDLKNIEDKEVIIERGDSPVISENGGYLAFTRVPKFVDSENNKNDKDKLKNDLLLLNLQTKEQEEITQSNNYSLSNNGQWLVYKTYPDKVDKKDDSKSNRVIGNNIFIRNTEQKTDVLIRNVVDYFIDSTSSYLFYTVSTSDGKNNGLFFRELNHNYMPETTIEKDSNCYFGNLTWSIKTKKLAYIKGALDSVKSTPIKLALKTFDLELKKNNEIVKNDFLKDWFLPNINSLNFSDNGDLIYFGIKPESDKPIEKDEDSKKKLSEDDLLDLNKIAGQAQTWTWHYNDPIIVPEQKIEWKQKKDRTFFAVFDFNQSKMIFDTTIISTNVSKNNNTKVVLLADETQYLKEITWKGWFSDYYTLNIQTGEKKLVHKYLTNGAYLSPDGESVVYFDTKKWYVYNTTSGETKDLTSIIPFAFHNLENDVPKEAGPYGFAGWKENVNKTFSPLIYDEFDIWQFDVSTNSTINLTNKLGRQSNTRLRISYSGSKKKYIGGKDTLLLSGFNKTDKSINLIAFNQDTKSFINKLSGDKIYTFRQKPEGSNGVVFTKQSFDEYPDFWISNFDLTNPQKVSDVNPEMKDFIWGKSYLTKWANSKGDSLEGYYVLPENYDPKKRYPVVIYFYEQMSQEKNRFIQPSNLHRPCFQVYLGDEYVMFLPDVKYYPSHPGQSSVDALVSGSRHLVEIGIADSNKIGIWGHSWSGYQGAYIVTQTDFFKAVVSGAPVGNMTSAYSGIRLGSGLARQFQYEQEQSRIGGSLVDSLDRYIENSPVFFADKMNTPILIEFGDEDDAVPYSQGIELYLAFRRFNKPAVMLQYEGEPHHLKKYANKVDYTIKMKEFYDHYLKGAPAPDWLKKGVEYKGTYSPR